MKRIAAIVVTYNRLNLLKKCIHALMCQTQMPDILIVNNASTDGTETWCAALTESNIGIHYFNTGENIGGAGGFNFGMKQAVAMEYDGVWIMDDDCLPAPDALEKLLKADAQLSEDYGYLSSVVLWKDGKECRMNRQKICKYYFDYAHYLSKGLIQVEQSTFVSLFFPIHTLRTVGYPIKDFFIWGDDIEYTRRIAIRSGLPSFMAIGSTVVHAMKTNDGSNIADDSFERIDRYRYAFRNEAFLYRQEGVRGLCYYFAKCAYHFLRILFHSKDFRLRRCRIMCSGMFQGLLFHPRLEGLD